MMSEQQQRQLEQGHGGALTPLHLLPRELLAEVVNWTQLPLRQSNIVVRVGNHHLQRTEVAAGAASLGRNDGDDASEVASIWPSLLTPPISGVYDSYVCSRIRRMPTVGVKHTHT